MSIRLYNIKGEEATFSGSSVIEVGLRDKFENEPYRKGYSCKKSEEEHVWIDKINGKRRHCVICGSDEAI